MKREVPKTAVVEVLVVLSVVLVSSSEVLSLSEVVVVEVVEESLSLLVLQEMMVKLIRNMDKMMSICLTRFPISGLGKPKLYQNMWCFTRKWDFTWRVSDCDELVGVNHFLHSEHIQKKSYQNFLRHR